MLKLLLGARKAHSQWKSLPDDQRQLLSGDVHRIRELVRELGGSPAVLFIEGDAIPVDESRLESRVDSRDRSVVIAELTHAIEQLMQKIAPTAGRLASESMPSSLKLGGRIASAGARRIRKT